MSTDAYEVIVYVDPDVFFASGPPGPPGPPGVSWTFDAGVPDDASGNDDDWYLDTTTGIYYTKIAGVWVVQGEMTFSITDHAELEGRSEQDCHPIASVTDLEDALAGLSPTVHSHVLADIDDAGEMAAINDAPFNGLTYSRRNGVWSISTAQVAWGGIIGVMADQVDLQTELDLKLYDAAGSIALDGKEYVRKDKNWVAVGPSLPVGGTDGQRLEKQSATDGDATWVDNNYSDLIGTPSEFPPSAHTHVEADITDLDKYTQAQIDAQWADHLADKNPHAKMNWMGIWQSLLYDTDDVVKDGEWTMVANKQTSDRAAPQPVGEKQFLLPEIPVWQAQSYAGIVDAGIHIHGLANSYQITSIRVWVPTVTVEAHYRIIVEDVLTGQLRLGEAFTGDILDSPGWVTRVISPEFLGPGSDTKFYARMENIASSSVFDYPWAYQGTSNNETDPGAGNMSRRGDHSILRVNKTDSDALDQATALLNITIGSKLKVMSDASQSAFIQYEVLDDYTDMGTWVSYPVALIDTGAAGEPTVGPAFLHADIPVLATTDYVNLPDAHLNDLAVDGFLVLHDGAGISDPNTSYGVDLEFQEFVASPDWDLLATSAAGTGSSGGGGGDLTDAPADGMFYGRKDIAWANPATADVVGLDAALADKSDISHNHDGYHALEVHTHTGSDITDLGELAYQDDTGVDGKIYIRQDNVWVEYTPSSNASILIQPDPPVSPADGDLWWDNSSGVGQMRVYYDDGNSLQWVHANSGLKGDTGPAGPQGIQGPIGDTGLKGDTGDQGIQGIQGIQGEIGPKGDTGDQGLPGVDGDTPDVTTQDDLLYGRIWKTGEVNPEWNLATEEAPQDGQQYVREDGTWTVIDVQALGASSSQQGFDFPPSQTDGFDHWYAVTATGVTVTIDTIFELHWRFNVRCEVDTVFATIGLTINLPAGKILAPREKGAIIGFVSVALNEFDVFGDLADG